MADNGNQFTLCYVKAGWQKPSVLIVALRKIANFELKAMTLRSSHLCSHHLYDDKNKNDNDQNPNHKHLFEQNALLKLAWNAPFRNCLISLPHNEFVRSLLSYESVSGFQRF